MINWAYFKDQHEFRRWSAKMKREDIISILHEDGYILVYFWEEIKFNVKF